MQESTVTEILDDSAKSGVSAKTGKAWSMSRVGLANGESVFIFNPIELGQVVEAVKDGEYTNWRPKRVDPKHDEIMKALRQIYAAVKPVDVPAPTQKDIVAEVLDDAPINLNDIPF
jgi:hypothetical protein